MTYLCPLDIPMQLASKRTRTSDSLIRRSAPGRVNLLGEHTDYTGGLVLPIAIQFATTATLTPAYEGYTLVSRREFDHARYLSVDDRAPAAKNWSDYVVGVLREFQKLGHAPVPFHISFTGAVPVGSGLSSSASIEVAMAMALLAHIGVSMPPAEIALLCRRAENEYVGSPCGIMDQYVSVAAKSGHALLLDTDSLHHEDLPLNIGMLSRTKLIVCNSMVKHSIAAGEYRSRRIQAEEGQDAIRALFPEATCLGKASLKQLDAVEDNISADAFRRCHHIITENRRVRAARQAINAGDAVALGCLMTGSHISQRDGLECSCEEIDFLVDRAHMLEGCYGARLTGGGFGGSMVSLVAEDKAERFLEQLCEVYCARYGIVADAWICTATDGAYALAEEANAR